MNCDDILDALSDRTRRSVFESLRSRPMTVREIADLQPVSRPAVSQHLKVLHTSGLVSVKTQGKRRIYSVRREGLEDLRAYLDGFWSDVLGAFEAEIELRKTRN